MTQFLFEVRKRRKQFATSFDVNASFLPCRQNGNLFYRQNEKLKNTR